MSELTNFERLQIIADRDFNAMAKECREIAALLESALLDTDDLLDGIHVMQERLRG